MRSERAPISLLTVLCSPSEWLQSRGKSYADLLTESLRRVATSEVRIDAASGSEGARVGAGGWDGAGLPEV